MRDAFIRLPNPDTFQTPQAIRTNPKFYPYFKNCRSAIDGTHLPIYLPASESAPSRGRKGLTQNVFAACDFDLLFVYVLAGWEGTASDARVYSDALRRGFRIRSNSHMFDIADAGFGSTRRCLTPYRGTRYHLKEWSQGNSKYVKKYHHESIPLR